MIQFPKFFRRRKPIATLGGTDMFEIQDVFVFVEDLSSRIENSGNPKASQEIRTGMGSLNGLTDGWALFLESLQRCMPSPGSNFSARESSDLQELTEYVRKIVYR